MTIVSPSILSADFGALGAAVAMTEKAGAQYVHIDVMDGHFVPNITIGAPVVKALRSYSSAVFDVHLMISHPQKYIEDFAKAGADIINIHVESDCSVSDTLQAIRALGKKTALTVKPKTDISVVYPYLDQIDMVLIMTVEPGFGGQSFMADMLPKFTALREEIDRRGLSVDIEVDGGINEKTAPMVIEAGANVLVAGNYIFSAQSPEAVIADLLSL